MNEFGVTGIGRYGKLRNQLELLREEFEEAAREYPPLYHQLVSPLSVDFSGQEWSAFKDGNTSSGVEWQSWEVFAGGESCSRFYGQEESLSTFARMAARGLALLSSMKGLAADGSTVLPEGFSVLMPRAEGHCGWLQLVYQTARCSSSPLLVARPGFWGCSGQMNGDEESVLATSRRGVRFPAHPFYEELRHDLFRSSAGAIDVWLDPGTAGGLGEYVSDSPVRLPPEPEPDGPARPDSFWLWGKEYTGFSEKTWLLLSCLWGERWVPLGGAIEFVYGHDEDKEGAVLSAVKRLNAELLAKGCPAEVHRKGGGVYLTCFQAKLKQGPDLG